MRCGIPLRPLCPTGALLDDIRRAPTMRSLVMFALLALGSSLTLPPSMVRRTEGRESAAATGNAVYQPVLLRPRKKSRVARRPRPVMLAPPEPESPLHENSVTPRVTPPEMKVLAASSSLDDDLHHMLDMPLIEGCDVEEGDCGGFRALITQDYQMAEAIWAGVFCSLCVSWAMHLVKVYIAVVPPP